MLAEHLVAVFAFDGISPFHLAVPTAVFASGSPAVPATGYKTVVCALAPGPVTTSAGYRVVVVDGLDAFAAADTVVVPSWDPQVEPPAALLEAVRTAHRRGARVVGLCLGAFVVAAAGVADGRQVATHWHWAAELQQRYPAVEVRQDVLWCDEGDVVTSAGAASALDCCLHLVRRDRGADLAGRVARALVLAPHRDGNQAQFVPTPVAAHPGGDAVDRALEWATHRLADPVTLDEWAAVAYLARRTFTRRFRERTGTSPGRWLLNQRLARARQLLETTDLPIEDVARQSGFGSAATLRQHFSRYLATSPRNHRKAFRTPEQTTPDALGRRAGSLRTV